MNIEKMIRNFLVLYKLFKKFNYFKNDLKRKCLGKIILCCCCSCFCGQSGKLNEKIEQKEGNELCAGKNQELTHSSSTFSRKIVIC